MDKKVYSVLKVAIIPSQLFCVVAQWDHLTAKISGSILPLRHQIHLAHPLIRVLWGKSAALLWAALSRDPCGRNWGGLQPAAYCEPSVHQQPQKEAWKGPPSRRAVRWDCSPSWHRALWEEKSAWVTCSAHCTLTLELILWDTCCYLQWVDGEIKTQKGFNL